MAVIDQYNDRATSTDDAEVVEALRNGDETVFAELYAGYHGAMLRVAGCYVADRATAEDVVQETWMAVVRGIDRFDGRCPVKAWIFRILTNRAKTIGQRGSRVVPISALAGIGAAGEAAVDASRFFDGGQWVGHWRAPVTAWDAGSEDADGEVVEVVQRAIESLPPGQRAVMTLRDVEGWTSQEVCATLALSTTNQRVLLHRARARVRARVERHQAMRRPT